MKAYVRLLAVIFLIPFSAPAIFLGQVDDFEDGTTMGWIEGAISPNPPSNVADGGPLGLGDNYLQNVASGSFGAGGRQIMFNQAQWTGDYLAAGVTALSAQMANFGPNELSMRITLNGGGGVFSSTTAFVLPTDGQWYSVFFGLSASDLSAAGGFSLTDTLSNVTEVRILSSGSPNFLGDPVNSTLGVDSITAIPEPASWLLILSSTALMWRARRYCS